MKILLIAQFDKYGGTREAFKRILTIQQKNGFETHVIIEHNSDEGIKEFIRSQGAEYTEMTKRGKFFNSMTGSLVYDHLNYSSILKKWKPDLVVASIGTSNFALYPFIRQYPMVYILHTIPMEFNIHIRLFYKIFSLLSCRNQLICGVSEVTVQSVIRNWGYEKKKTVVLHNTFMEKNIHGAKKNINRNSKVRILTLGILSWYKNPERWLEVAKEMTSRYEYVEFIWLGDGKLLEKFKKRTKNETQIHFLGFRENVKEYYSEASIYFQPSLKENHSFSVLDAMANGLPCVVSNVGGQPESIKEGVNGYLCEPDNSSGFIEKLSVLIENPDVRMEMGEKAKIHAYHNFNPNQYETKLLKLYNKALNL